MKQGTCYHRELQTSPSQRSKARRIHLCIDNLNFGESRNKMLPKGTFPQTAERLHLQLKNPDFSARQVFSWEMIHSCITKDCRERQRKHLAMRRLSLWSGIRSLPSAFCLGKWDFAHTSYSRMAATICSSLISALQQRRCRLIRQGKGPSFISRIPPFFIQVISVGTSKCQVDTF